MLDISDVQWQNKTPIAEIRRAPQYILYIIKDKGKIYTETATTVGDIFKIRGFSGIWSRQVFRRML